MNLLSSSYPYFFLYPWILLCDFWQLSHEEYVEMSVLEQKWKDLCLPVEQLKSILALDNFGMEVEWMKFFALGCSALGGSIRSALKHACEILTKDPEGGPARIPFDIFKFLYLYLSQIDGEITEEQTDAVLSSLEVEVHRQDGMVQPRNFMSALCPPLS